jgi:hypothetical protein
MARELDPPLTMPDTVVAWATVPERLPGALIENIRGLANALRRESDSNEGSDQEAGGLGARDSGIGDRGERGG